MTEAGVVALAETCVEPRDRPVPPALVFLFLTGSSFRDGMPSSSLAEPYPDVAPFGFFLSLRLSPASLG